MVWAYVASEAVVFGRGRTVYAALDDVVMATQLKLEAATIYEKTLYFRQHSDKAEFVAALSAALAVRDMVPQSATAFANIQQLTGYFSYGDTQQNMLNLYNSIIASGFAVESNGAAVSTENIAHAVNLAFMEGQLLRWPQDADRLRTPAVLGLLPGIAYGLLGLEKGRPAALPTFARQVRIEAEYRARRGA